jgi:type IV pilus assembly protein PilA
MSARWPTTVLASLLLLACDKGSSEDKPAGDPPAVPLAPSPAADAAPAVPKMRGAVEMPRAVPADASAVIVMRVPKSLFDSVVGADPLGLATEGLDDMKEDLDAFLGRTLGLEILDAKSVCAFLVGKQDFGVVLIGVEGDLQAKKVGAHEGVDLYATGGDLQLARVDDMLLMGTETAVKSAISATKDQSKSAAGSDLAVLLAANTEGAAMALAIDVKKAPQSLTREIPDNLEVDRILVSFGAEGLKLRAEGEQAKLDALAGAINSGLTMAADAAEQQRKRTMESEGDVAEGVATIIAAHYAKSAKGLLTPKVEGGALTIAVPMKAGDPAVLTAIAGMSAAIAIPAFTKYMRRSKTSEARVQLAKMFDAASSYFNEEHVDRSAIGLLGGTVPEAAPHRCPNDGRTSGQSGITPPLSVDCNAGPGGRCVPASGGTGPGYYDVTLWTDNDVWNGLNFQQEQAHAFHYNFIWSNEGTGYGACQFTAQAFGDLDGDGVFSTYERTGAADEYGVNAAAGLYIDQEIE